MASRTPFARSDEAVRKTRGFVARGKPTASSQSADACANTRSSAVDELCTALFAGAPGGPSGAEVGGWISWVAVARERSTRHGPDHDAAVKELQ